MGHYDGFGLTKEKENHNFHSVLSALKQFLKKAHLTVTINGKAYPVIGEVGLSHTAVDVTGSSVQPGDIATCYCDPSKAKRELGWQATRSLEEMCEDSWRWQKQNPNGYPD